MSQLRREDAVGILDILGSLHEAATPEDVGHLLIGRLSELVACDVVSYNDIDVATPSSGGTHTFFEPELTPRPELEFAFDALQHEHPLVCDYAATGDPAPRRMSDFISLPDLHALDLWREVFLPLETNHQIAFAVLASRSRVIGIGVNRWSHDFDDHDMAVLGELQKHVGPAFHHAALRSAETSRAPGALDVLSTREREVLALVAAGHSTPRIAALLFLSPRTVDKHLDHVRSKLGARTRAQAAAMFHASAGPASP